MGLWGIEFYMYVPLGKEANWDLQGTVPLQAGEWIIGNIFYNRYNATPGEGFIQDSALGVVSFNFPHDEWFRIVMNFDISGGLSLATWQFNVDGVDVIPPGTAFTNEEGDIPTSLGGMLSMPYNSDIGEFYLDDFQYTNALIDVLAINDYSLNLNGIFATPNPVSDILYLKANETISEVVIYNTLGQIIKTYKINSVDESIDMSSYDNGVYLVEVITDNGQTTKRIIKN